MNKLAAKVRQWLASYDRWLAHLGLHDYGCPCANMGKAVKDKKLVKHSDDKESGSSHL
ncbi:hypothetical protein [Celerinatantimonas diazotrophica]|uniref:hypothetical protein n=1 Tax=Celerinatantimonas diazotrophica TaxID=412034 RepID=UPI001404327D|nr:hypothetical protein [Celerinatantimonas diazotrophica]